MITKVETSLDFFSTVSTAFPSIILLSKFIFKSRKVWRTAARSENIWRLEKLRFYFEIINFQVKSLPMAAFWQVLRLQGGDK